MRWHRRAAELGHTQSELFVGVRYFDGGYAIKKQPADAFRFLSAAAEAGDDVADVYVGQCLWTGFGVKQDRRKALPHFLRGIEHGSIKSFRYLGLAATLGMVRGDNPDVEAYLFFAIGAALDDPESALQLSLIRERMQKPDIDTFDGLAMEELARLNALWGEYHRKKAREKTGS